MFSSGWRVGALGAFVAVFCMSCSPGVKTFAEAWAKAARARDGVAAWQLLDKASRARIVTALQRTQERAQKDERLRALVASTFAPADPALPPEQLAQKLLAAQLALAPNADAAAVTSDGKDGQVTLGGRTTKLHLEDGAWRADVDALVLATDGAPVVVEYVLPFAAGPVAPPPPSAQPAASASAATAAPTRVEIDPKVIERLKAEGKLEPVQEIVTQMVTPEGTTVQITRRTASRIFWTRRFMKGSDSYTERDLDKHTLTIANGATKVLTRMYLGADNKELRADERVERYDITTAADGSRPLRLKQIQHLEGGRVVVERPDDKVPDLLVVRSQKDTKGSDLVKLSGKERAEALTAEGRVVDDALVAFRIRAPDPAGFDKALDRAAELAKLPDGFGGAVRAVVLFERGPGQLKDVRDADYEIVLLPDPRLVITESISTPDKLGVEERVRVLPFGLLSAPVATPAPSASR